MKNWKAFLSLCLISLSLVIGIGPKAIGQSPPTSELRGVWLTNIDSDVLFSDEKLEEGVERLKQLHFNTLYPTVWNWGYTLYPSKVAEEQLGERQRLYPDLGETGQVDPREEEQRDRDMLKKIVKLGRKADMAVIPWFEFGFMAPAESELAKRHPDWLTQMADGTTIKQEGTHPRVWLNPLHPEVQQFLEDLVVEVLDNYKVDGIQFDDHLGLPAEYGYDDLTVQLYQQEHNGDRPPEDYMDEEWTRWRASKITAVMARLFQAIKTEEPEAVVSLSPNPAEFAYETFLQDWVTWERRGYIEEIVIQVYREDRDRFLMEIERPEVVNAQAHVPVSIGILSGLKGRNISINWLWEQVRLVRDRKFAGVAFFFYETLWQPDTETPEQRLQGLQALFPEEIERPSLLTGWEP